MENKKQFVYIVQAENSNVCKIGITDNLERRLKDYNNMTGKSKSVVYQYLFTCEVNDMTAVEKDIKTEFSNLREQKSKEIYFYNPTLFENYVNFIKSHKLFIKETFIKTDEKPKVKEIIVPRTTPSLKDRGVTTKDVMQRAKRVKNDEFYTRYVDIEKEVSRYDKSIWKGKTVFCNCDDAVDDELNDRRTSAFALFFIKNFDELELEKLICTHYAGAEDLFNQGPEGYVYTYIYTRDGLKGIKDYPPGFNGSFDHPLSLKILNEEADIVCTNPPFSRTRDFWKIMIASGKKFLIISNTANVLTASYVPYFKNNQVWAGYNRVDWYENPKRQLTEASGHWYTNIPIENRLKYNLLKIMPLKNMPEKCKKYDDSKILIVKDSYIPSDYKKPFAVSSRSILNGVLEKGYKMVQDKEYYPYIKGKKQFAKVLIQKI